MLINLESAERAKLRQLQREKELAQLQRSKLLGLRDHLRNLIAKRQRISYEIRDLSYIIKRKNQRLQVALKEQQSLLESDDYIRKYALKSFESFTISEMRQEIISELQEGIEDAQNTLTLLSLEESRIDSD